MVPYDLIHFKYIKETPFALVDKRGFFYGTSVHNGLNQNEIIPAAGTHIPNFFIGTFDFSEALLYNGLKGGRII